MAQTRPLNPPAHLLPHQFTVGQYRLSSKPPSGFDCKSFSLTMSRPQILASSRSTSMKATTG